MASTRALERSQLQLIDGAGGRTTGSAPEYKQGIGGLAYGEYKGIEGPAEGNIHSVYMGLRSTTTGSAPECKE